MTTNRDESKDIQVSAESLTLTRESATYPFNGQFLPYVACAPSDLSGWVRFVSYDQYAAVEKERDELRERVEQYDAEQLARVCPGCHSVAPEPCSPGCIDAKMEREREDERMNGDPRDEEDDDEEDIPW